MRFPVLAAFCTRAGNPAAAQTAPWDYTGKRGELVWGKLDPAYQACSKAMSSRRWTFAAPT